MKKTIILLGAMLIPTVANANNWDLSAHGLLGAYYGLAQTKDVNKYPNRWVQRTDAILKADYVFNSEHKLGIHASTTVMFRQDDKNRRGGEYRFYPFVADVSKYGEVYLGYAQNAANMLHKGAKDITFLKVDDSNATYFLSNPNWDNGYKKVAFATPKSTSIMNDGRAPKFTYIKPFANGTKLGFSYTPDNAHRRGMVSRYADYETNEDGYTFAIQQKYELGQGVLYTSLGYGIFNETDKETSYGVTYEYKNFNIAMGYKKGYIDGNKNPITTTKINSYLPAYFDNYRESEAFNISMGYNFDKLKTNIAYLNTSANNTRHQDNMLLWTNVYGINKHVELYSALAYLNTHSLETEDNNRGYAVMTGFGIKF